MPVIRASSTACLSLRAAGGQLRQTESCRDVGNDSGGAVRRLASSDRLSADPGALVTPPRASKAAAREAGRRSGGVLVDHGGVGGGVAEAGRSQRSLRRPGRQGLLRCDGGRGSAGRSARRPSWPCSSGGRDGLVQVATEVGWQQQSVAAGLGVIIEVCPNGVHQEWRSRHRRRRRRSSVVRRPTLRE